MGFRSVGSERMGMEMIGSEGEMIGGGWGREERISLEPKLRGASKIGDLHGAEELISTSYF